tara:strand:- start:7231 stop:8229 length:999 start_codon:yes stop_codon:yes gene_type:complete
MPEENMPLILGSEGQEQNMPLPESEISNDEFFSLMDTEMNKEPSFPEEQMTALRKKFEGMKLDYANGSKEDQALLEADVVQTGDRLSKAEQFKVSLAGMLMTGSEIGHNPTEKLAEYTSDIVNIVNGNNEVTYDGNIPGYELHDGWTSMDDIEKLIQSRYIDNESKSLFNLMITDQQKLAADIQPGENAHFNAQKVHADVRSKIVETGDVRSLAVDRIFGNRVFKDDLMSSIESGTYADFGLSEEQVMSMDPTPENSITPEDTTVIVSSIMQDENMLKEYLTDYYVKALEQNFYDNLRQDTRETMRASKHSFEQPPTGLRSRPDVDITEFAK